jgi:uncharacterized protein
MKQRSSWGVAARAVLFVVCSAVLLAIASRWTKGNLQTACATAVATFLLTLLFLRWEGVGLADAGAKLVRGSFGRFAFAFLVGLGLPLTRAGVVMMVTGLRYDRMPGFSFVEVMIALVTYIALACREELAFRGYPLRMLDRRFGAWIALLATAILFALEHVLGGWSWWQALFGSGVGALLFGAAALRTRGLAVPIGLHAAWNFGDAMLGGKGMPGLWKPAVAADAMARVEATQWIAYVLIMMAAATAIWFWPRGGLEVVEG